MHTIFESYLRYLSSHPERVDSIYLWTLCTAVLWTVLFINRKDIIVGLKGSDSLWESPEVVIYIILWIFPPVIFFATYFSNDPPSGVWFVIWGSLAFAMGGKWIFKWFLAFRAGTTQVEETTTTTVKTENETPS